MLPQQRPHVYGNRSQNMVKLARKQNVRLDLGTRLKTDQGPTF